VKLLPGLFKPFSLIH